MCPHTWLWSRLFFFPSSVLRLKPRALYILSKHSTIELNPQTLVCIVWRLKKVMSTHYFKEGITKLPSLASDIEEKWRVQPPGYLWPACPVQEHPHPAKLLSFFMEWKSCNWTWWRTPVIPSLWRQRQEDCDTFEDSLSLHTASSQPARTMQNKNKKEVYSLCVSGSACFNPSTEAEAGSRSQWVWGQSGLYMCSNPARATWWGLTLLNK